MIENKEWIFSVIGIPLVTAFLTVLFLITKKLWLRDKHNNLRELLLGHYNAYHIRATGWGCSHIGCSTLVPRHKINVPMKQGQAHYP